MEKHDGRQAALPEKRSIRGRPVLVPPPDPLAERWVDRYPREISQQDAARITHRSRATARAWAAGGPIEPLALQVLQWVLWGRVVPDPFHRRGIRFEGMQLHTRSGYPLEAADLDALAWTIHNLTEQLHALQAAGKPARRAQDAPPPRGWYRRRLEAQRTP